MPGVVVLNFDQYKLSYPIKRKYSKNIIIYSLISLLRQQAFSVNQSLPSFRIRWRKSWDALLIAEETIGINLVFIHTNLLKLSFKYLVANKLSSVKLVPFLFIPNRDPCKWHRLLLATWKHMELCDIVQIQSRRVLCNICVLILVAGNAFSLLV